MNRNLVISLGMVLVILVGIAVFQLTQPPTIYGAIIDPPKAMSAFSLPSVNGPVSLSDSQGKLTLVFFGFTHCKDVCPATLAKLAQVMTDLGDKSGQVQVLFISVDYKRDTPQVTADYVHKFNQHFIGLAGSQAEIDAVTKNYGVYYKLDEPDASGDYEVEHTALVMVLDRQGRLVMTWSPDQQPDEISSDLTVLLKQ